MGEIRDELLAELGDADFRHAYASEFIDMVLARQIRSLRKQRGLTQAQLGEMLGTGQSFISQIENEDYGSLSIKTLKELARAFDTYLTVRFESFRSLANAVEHTSMDELRVPKFGDDPAFAAVTDQTVFLEGRVSSRTAMPVINARASHGREAMVFQGTVVTKSESSDNDGFTLMNVAKRVA